MTPEQQHALTAVACPFCGAAAGQKCWTLRNYRPVRWAYSHDDRWQAAGVTR